MTTTPLSTALSGLTDALAGVSSVLGRGLSDAELIDVTAVLEHHKRTCAAVQAEAAAALSASVKLVDQARGIATRDRGCSVAPMIAAARGETPHAGGRYVGLALALTQEMPRTLTALRSGRISEWTATGIVGATTFLSREDRAMVDEALVKEFTRHGVAGARIVRSARALAQHADPAAAVARMRTAESERCVSIRPAPDTMTLVTALLPVADGVAVHAALLKAVAEHQGTRDPNDERSRGAVMADVFTERVTGRRPVSSPVPVVVNLVMSVDALLGQGEEPASIPGMGSLPARAARRLITDAVGEDRAWVRRLFTSPDQSTLVAMESTRRRFPRTLALFLALRDQRCATPFCDALIQHTDHLTPHARGGPTSAENGQGLCARCNYTKEQPGFSSARDPVTGTTTYRTPTGHSTPGPRHRCWGTRPCPPRRQQHDRTWTGTRTTSHGTFPPAAPLLPRRPRGAPPGGSAHRPAR